MFLDENQWNDINRINPEAPICIIADYPSHQDVQLRQGYSDTAGSTLSQCLGYAGLSMADVSLIFIVQEGCTQATFDRFWTPKSGFTSRGTAYFGHLQQAIRKANANVYIPVGEAALNALTGRKGITKWRGSILPAIDYFNNVKTISTIDPRVAVRQYLYRYHIAADFRRVKREMIHKEINLPQRNLYVQPSFEESLDFLERCKNAKQVAVDIEVYKMEVSCISFAISPTECMSIPFDTRWDMLQEMQLWRSVASVLEDERIEKIFQNGLFDMSFLLRKNRIITRGYVHDTMIKHHMNYPDFPKGLGFITSLYTDEPYYKDEGKTWFNDLKGGTGSIDQFYIYNAKDSAVCFEANIPITEELKKFGNQKTYDFNEKLMRPILYMMERGILIDEEALRAARKRAHEEQVELQKKLDALCGFSLNVASPAQCKNYFYNIKKYPVQLKKSKDPKTGGRRETISADDKAMKKLIRKYNSEEAKLVTQIRKYRKLIGTYLDVAYDPDKRLRCSFSISGTSTGRLSSSETIFGTGTNMQNLPKTFKEFLIADPGYIMCEVDKAQAEWVATAYIAGDARMIEAVEAGIDAHVHTSHLMFGIPKDLILKEHEVLETSTDEDYIKEQRMKHCPEILQYKNILPNMSCRQAGKKSNHSFNYGLSPQGFSIQYDMELKYSKQCHELYHNAYPGLRIWHQHIINQLGKDRTLINLFGRKRRFLNRWNDDLFKAAYSYEPQSTVGQLLNHGIVETYYQQTEEQYKYLRKWDLLNQCHDSMLFQYPANDIEGFADTILQIVKNLEPTLYKNGREFKIKTDCKIGLNAKKMFSIDCYATRDQIIAQLKQVISDKLTTKEETQINIEEVEEDEDEIQSDESEE